ncbi:hypothetical protein C1646_776965 [Rhizophagus diaphanus]|nr:hypothetical protein C1646_776965 [Rhizophagus diaphanus] [Rhizophagus sp. MUCL 43196]
MQTISYWRPSSKLQILYNKFQNIILSQWPQIACIYCGKLLYPEQANWVLYDPSITYPLQQQVPDISLTFHPNTNCIPESRVPTCNSCKKPSTRYSFPYLLPIPEEIASVPLYKRKYLSPVYLHYSLERTPNSNPYSEYRSLTARHIQSDIQAPPVNLCDIIVLNYDFPSEVHNEDFHYTRLMVGFIQESNNLHIPIPTYDPNLEPLLFPDIFTDGRGHFHDMLDQQRQNAQLNSSNNPRHPSARDLLQPSAYISHNIIDENMTLPIPTFICTGDTYFHQKQLHLNAMIQKIGLPKLFIILSMAEN